MSMEIGGKTKFYKDVAELLVQGKKDDALKLVLNVTEMDTDEIHDFLGKFEGVAEEVLNTINALMQSLGKPHASDNAAEDPLESIRNFAEAFEGFTDLMVEKFGVDLWDLKGEYYVEKPLKVKAMDELLSTDTKEIYKIGKPKKFSDSNGPQVSMELVHFKLDEKKLFSGPFNEESIESLREKTNSQLVEWHRRYLTVRGNKIAQKATESIHKSIVCYEAVLHDILQRKMFSVWNYLENISEPENKVESSTAHPDKSELLLIPVEPCRSDKKYNPEVGLMGKLFGGGSRKKREKEVEENFLADQKRWQAEKENIVQQNLEIEAKYAADVDAFENNKKSHLNKGQKNRLESITRVKELYLSKDPEVIIDYCQMVLALLSFPGGEPRHYDFEYLVDDKTIVVDCLMPVQASLPIVKALDFYYIEDDYDFKDDDYDFEDERMSKVEFLELSKGFYIQVALCVISELFKRDEAKVINSIVFNGWNEACDYDTGEEERFDFISMKVDKESFSKLDFSASNPQSCFELLKGRINLGVNEIKEVDPFAMIIKKKTGSSFPEKGVWLDGLNSLADAEMQRIRETSDKKSEILTEDEDCEWMSIIWRWADKNRISEDDIPRERKGLLELSWLQLLVYPKLKNIPKEIGNLQNITSFDVNGSMITTLPKEIGKLLSLERLDLGDNKLKELPDEIGNLGSLQLLYCNSNKLVRIPESIGKLHFLEIVNFSDNKIIEIPESIGKLHSLEDVNFSDNEIIEIPKTIGQLTELETLRLENNKIQEIPSELCNLTTLTKLHLEGNFLKKLPSEIDKLKNLNTLWLSDNHLEELPPEIGGLENLDFLYVDGNHLTKLPLEIANLKKLNSLNISDNRLTHIPEEVLALELEYFFYNGNKNDLVNEAAKELTHIDELGLDEYQEEGELFDFGELRVRANDLDIMYRYDFDFDVENKTEESINLGYNVFLLDDDGYILSSTSGLDKNCPLTLEPFQSTTESCSAVYFDNEDRPITVFRLRIENY